VGAGAWCVTSAGWGVGGFVFSGFLLFFDIVYWHCFYFCWVVFDVFGCFFGGFLLVMFFFL
jgi:hypothetical protein